jgi:hypothetical protein
METAAYYRRQAGFLLRLGQSCTDRSVIQHLELMAAEFHLKAIEAEFYEPDSGLDVAPPGQPPRPH